MNNKKGKPMTEEEGSFKDESGNKGRRESNLKRQLKNITGRLDPSDLDALDDMDFDRERW